MPKEQKKKNHHYVPQFLLRRFGNDRSTNVLILESGKFISNVGIKDQCSENYFYGPDGKIEKGFEDLEGTAATIIRKIEESGISSLAEDEDMNLRSFITFQMLRTLGQAELSGQVMANSIFMAMEKDPNFSDLKNKYEIVFRNTQFMNLELAISSLPLLLDLRVKLLIRDKGPDLVLSDNPVTRCNQWAQNHPKFSQYEGLTGLSSKGLQIFLPISKRTCLALYDADTYEYGSPSKTDCRISKTDVMQLNKLQTFNAVSCIYFEDENPQQRTCDELVGFKKQGVSDSKFNISEGPVTPKGDGRMSQIVLVSPPNPRLDNKFSFAREIDHSKFVGYNKVILPVRSEELLKESQIVSETVQSMINKVSKGASP